MRHSDLPKCGENTAELSEDMTKSNILVLLFNSPKIFNILVQTKVVR